MTVPNKPNRGQVDWDVPLNNALDWLDNKIDSVIDSEEALRIAGDGVNAQNITDLTTGTDTFASLQFNTATPGSANVAGKLAWNDTDGTLDLRLKDGSVTLQLGQEFVARVYNDTAATLGEGRVVRVSGASGQRMTVALANPSNDANSSTTLGVVTQSGGIGVNQSGYVTLSGLVRGINTADFEEGDVLWLAANGTFTSTKPVAPTHLVQVGYVVIASNNGSIYVHVQNGYELDELHNVKITNPQNNDVLKYNSSLGIWVNGPI